MIKSKQKKNIGFIALMSAIIISTILLLIVANTSLTGFYSRSQILESELKARSSALADACVDKALLGLAQGINFTGNVSIGADKCLIRSITSSGGNKVISIQAVFQNSYTNLKVTIDSATLSVISWEEI